MFHRHNRQRGQVVVLFAVGSMALVGMVGLVLMSGLLFWDQRQLQVLSDGSALAAAETIPRSCTDSTPITTADNFLTQQFGVATSALSVSGGCPASATDSTHYTGTATYSCYNTTCSVTYVYPWNEKSYEIEVSISRSGIPLQFGAFIGTSQATVGGRAVAQHNFAAPPSTFALFVQNGGLCQGSSTQSQNPKVDVRGSIYSDAALSWSGNCGYYAHDTIAFDGTEDYGDVLVYPDGQSWGTGQCTTPVEQAICADGFELSGHLSPTCGNAPWSGVSPTTEYLTDTTTKVADPCQGVPPPVPNRNETTYQGTEPNSDAAVDASIGGACSSTGKPDGLVSRSGVLQVGTKKATTYGYGPTPSLSGGIEHFKPGCYGYLDIGTFLGAAGLSSPGSVVVKLDPGFYYFNGYTSSTGGGLCLTKTNAIVLGTDVTMEFVNGTSFSTTACASTPTSSCGSSITCDFGQGIAAPSAPTASTGTGTGLPAGTYTFDATYLDSSGGETTASTTGTSWTLSSPGAINLSSSGTAPLEASSAAYYLVSYSGSGTVQTGYLGSAAIGTSLAFTSPTQGDYTQPPVSNTAVEWLAAPPTSPESPPAQPTVTVGSGVSSNLPAGTYNFAITYVDPEGQTPASTTASATTTTSGQDISITTAAAPQGVTAVKFYLLSPAPTGVNTGYIGEISAPDGTSSTPRTLTFTSATHGNGATPPTTNTTSSAWCSATNFLSIVPGYTSTQAATSASVCANRLIWAPPANCTCGLSEISGEFYVKGPGENSALLGNLYWPGPANSTPTANTAGCNYDANGVGGLLGQVICDSLFVQGGAQAGNAAIGYTTGAQYSSPPEISLVE
ncbi:MAG TPA: hypothetical protein VF137_07660 [Candidatus Dormibacteraeota bacterium]